ncbi:MAG: DUF2254 domain-containing protein [Pirellulales bacterium]
MRSKLLYWRDVLRTSYWFIPLVMTAGSIALAFASVELDRTIGGQEQMLSWSYTGGPDGARSMLAVAASSMITVAGVVFSITIVSLSLASSQFGPRLLRNFIRDRGNQAVLGTFIATFVYCLLVQRTVRGDGFGSFVPGVSMVVAVLLVLANMMVLIYFIHHVATTIQANEVVGAVAAELQQTIERLFPERLDEHRDEMPRYDVSVPDAAPASVAAKGSGYVVTLDEDQIVRIAEREDLCVRMACSPGHFVVAGDRIAEVWPAESLDEETHAKIADALELDLDRSALQDVGFGIDQLVEVAVRALSPGVNDPFTAMTCIDRLSQALCLLAERKIPSPQRFDDSQRLRVILTPLSFPGMLDEAYDQIREYGSSSTAVSRRLLQALERIARRVRRPEDLEAIERQGKLVMRGAKAIAEEEDGRDVKRRMNVLEKVVSERRAQLASDSRNGDAVADDQAKTVRSLPKDR